MSLRSGVCGAISVTFFFHTKTMYVSLQMFVCVSVGFLFQHILCGVCGAISVTFFSHKNDLRFPPVGCVCVGGGVLFTVCLH